ncbi:protein NUCLEAR FUSION DEFECTIVE 4-like [Amaranthus tricolor]|uniref:protein NUCLEAR FUSION DEFECTIVE 4-like n=1 Tax=Amaranthus tricolor TaxID=29722 RepID=UPI00258DE831|nr:protein NUCLEAR FUSION DEFECTIVE 4-like [Amaranthus tricolor]
MENMFSNRWIATVASIWIQATMGGSYAFGVYSPVLKSSQSYDQSTLDTVSVFKDIGANAGVLSGLLYAARATSSGSWRWRCFNGPWVVLATGAIQCFLGYFFMWLAVVGVIPRPPVGIMCLFMFLAAHAQTFFSTANVVTGVLNFPDYNGTIVGILKGFLGLTGAITIQIYQAFFKGNQSTFILILALLPSTVTFSVMCLVKICPDSKSHDKMFLNRFSMVALTLAAFLMIVIISENLVEFPQYAHYITVAILLFLLSLPLLIALQVTTKENSNQICVEKDSSPQNLYAEAEKIGYKKLPSTSDDNDPDEQSMDIVDATKSLNFWLLFISMSCGMGSGLATINNMSQIGQSLGYDIVKTNTLVSLWSIWNFLGRFGAGYLSDILLRQYCYARPIMIAITLATMTAGHLIICLGFAGNLYIGTILVGICYGAQWSLMPTITAEIFGVKHMGTIFNTIGIASPIGTYILSVWVIGYVYDKEARGSDDNTCYGVHCFMSSFLILACVSFLGFLVALTLFFRTRVFYNSVVLRRLHIL